jgi:hypothetical protein
MHFDTGLRPTGPSIAPTHILDFSDLGDLYSAALSPDGSRLYALVHAPVVDFGRVFATYWPEWMGTLAGLFTLILLIPLALRLRRRQRDGDPYCPRCNYNLSGQSADPRCPECGLNLSKRPPIKGRRAWGRSRPIAVAIVLVLGAYGTLLACRVPRDAAWLQPDWTSVRAVSWCDKRGFEWLARFKSKGDMVLEVDASTGQRLRTVCSRSSQTFFQLVLTPDGSGLYLCRSARDGIALVNIADGHVVASYVTPPAVAQSGTMGRGGEFLYEAGHSPVIGHTRDGSAVLSYWSDSTTIAHAAVWNPKTGKSTIIASTQGYVDATSNALLCEGRQFVMVGQTDPIRVISTPLFMESQRTNSFEVRWFGPDGRETRKVDLWPDVGFDGMPAVVPDGSLAFFSTYGRVIALDLATGSREKRSDVYEDMASPTDLIAGIDGVRLFVPGSSHIAVCDIQRKERTADLKAPLGYHGPRAISSPTPSRAAAVYQGPAKTKPGRSFVAAIWDIPPSPPQETKP